MKAVKHIPAGAAVIVFILSVRPVAAEPCPKDAETFWNHFRQAVVSGKLKAVTEHVYFPFNLRGTLDGSESDILSIEEFNAAFPKLMSTDPGLSAEPTTMRALVSKTRSLGSQSCNKRGTEFRVGTWTFQLTPKGWLLVRAYTDD